MDYCQLEFGDAVAKANEWIREIAQMLDVDSGSAYQALRSVLHALRDRLTTEEASQLAAQMPVLIRGVFFEGWRPGKQLKAGHDLAQFLGEVSAQYRGKANLDAQEAASTVFGLLELHISDGEVEDVEHILPRQIRTLWPGVGKTAASL